MIHFLNVASGSKGNMSIIYNDSTCIVVDFGITRKRFLEALNHINKKIEEVDAYLFTHDHTDHISGIDFADLSRTFSVKNVIYNSKNANLKPYDKYYFGDIEVTIVETSHDASNSCGFIFDDGETSIAYITDTGTLCDQTLNLLHDKNVYYFESNYDLEMLKNSGRPACLINRIKSKKGHLSNEKSSKFLLNLVNSNTEKVVLAHLSEECNTPELALEMHENTWHKLEENSKIELVCAKQREMTDIC